MFLRRRIAAQRPDRVRRAFARTVDETVAKQRDWAVLGLGWLTEFPPGLERLTRIRKLKLFAHHPGPLLPAIARLENVEDLSLCELPPFNRPVPCPPEIGQLTNLRALWIHYGVTSLPAEIGQLSNLQALFVEHAMLTALPPEIGQLANLTWLHVQGRLEALPPEIGQLHALETLTLNFNRLRSLPPEIGQLTNLKSLGLGDNRLTSLPAEIGRLPRLERLTIGGNPISDLPPGIAPAVIRG